MTNDELRALANAATPGPWTENGADGWTFGIDDPAGEPVVWTAERDDSEEGASNGIPKDADAAYIAAASPATVLALLDERDALRVALTDVRHEMQFDLDRNDINTNRVRQLYIPKIDAALALTRKP